MPLVTDMRPGETLTVNGIRIVFRQRGTVDILDEAHILYPNGKTSSPPQKKEQDNGERN